MDDRSPAAVPFDPAAAGWDCPPDAGFIDLVGPFWTRLEGAERLYGFVAQPKHANLIGVVQGGMLMTFADRSMGLAAWESAARRPSVTVHFDMDFLSAARIGEFVQIRSEVTRRTASLIFLRARLGAGDRDIATASGIWKLLRDRQG